MLFPDLAFLAAFDWSKFWASFGTPILITLGIVLIGHFVAAKLLMPEPNAGKVLGAFLLHLVFAVVVLPISVLLSLGGAGFFGIASLIVIVLGGAVTAGIYKVGIGRGIVYNIAVLFAAAGISWGASKVLEAVYSPMAEYYRNKPAEDQMSEQAAETAASSRQDADGAALKPAPYYATTQEAQAAAIKLYPELGKAGSAFNTRFLAKHRAYAERKDPILNSPDWPVTVAREVAAEIGAR